MDNILKTQSAKIVGDLVVSAIKSVARHNKRASEILMKGKDFIDEKLQEHNNFLDDIIAILKPALHLAHSILEKFLPGYIHIIDWIVEMCKDVGEELIKA